MTKLRKGLAIVLSLILVLTIIPTVSEKVETKAAETFSIISPTANQLVAAGYIDIEWEAATAGTVYDYDVFINGSKVSTTTDTSCEYYTTKVQAFEVNVKANYTDGTSETTETITFGVTKKGLGLATDMGANISLRDMGVAWYYNWGTGPSSGEQYQGIEFVPMQWGNDSYNNINNRMNNWASRGYKYALAFNEPDLNGQGVTSVDDAVSKWPAFQNHGIRVGSPASFLWPAISTWLQDFMIKIDNNVDFITIHCYPENNPGGKGMADWFLSDVVDTAWEMYHKPIWVTEFSTADTTDNNSAVTAQGTSEFWKYVMQGLDEREYVERYAAFCFNSANKPGVGLWNYGTGELTLGGQTYSEYGNPANFTPAVPPEPDYKVTTERRNTLLDDTKTINGVVCEDYVNASGVTATSDSEIGNNGLASLAIDDSANTRWESKHGVDPASLTIDLGSVRNVKEVDVLWENASASLYNIEVSTDGVNWITAAEGITGNGGRCDMVTLKSQVSARYVKIHGISRSTDYGYSIFDVAIYGSDDVKVDETTSKAPVTTTQTPTTTFEPVDVENETSETNMLSGLDWTTYVGTWAGANGTITEENGVVNGSFVTTGGGHGEAIYGIQAQALDLVVEAGAEYTYSTKIKATKDMTIRFKITDGQTATETQLVFETINLKAGETYDYSTTFVAPSNEVDFVFALGGGTEGATTDVSIGIASNNLIKIKDAPTTVASTTTTTVAPTTTTEVSGETTTVSKPKKAKIKKVYAKNKASKKVKVSIKRVKGVVGYQVAIYKTRKNAKNDKKALVKKIVRKRKVTITRKKLKNKKKLFVRVRAYKLDGKKKVWGKWSNIKNVRIKKTKK